MLGPPYFGKLLYRGMEKQMETSIMVFCTLLCPGMAKQMESSTIVLYYYIGMEKGRDTSIIV